MGDECDLIATLDVVYFMSKTMRSHEYRPVLIPEVCTTVVPSLGTGPSSKHNVEERAWDLG